MIAEIMRLGILTFVLLGSFFFAGTALAQEQTSPSAQLTITPSVDYTLPYPGILPNNPFYSLKMVRDRIVLFLINDSVKKAQFTLLQANKRLQAGTFLYRENPQEVKLAVETIAKGENYFFQAIQHAKNVEMEGRTDFTNLLSDLHNAALKHEETLLLLEKEFPKEYQSEIAKQRERVLSFQKEVDS